MVPEARFELAKLRVLNAAPLPFGHPGNLVAAAGIEPALCGF